MEFNQRIAERIMRNGNFPGLPATNGNCSAAHGRAIKRLRSPRVWTRGVL